MSDNPYQAPADMAGWSDGNVPDPQLDRTVDMLRQTKPWVRFISVMIFIGSALMILLGLFMMLGMTAHRYPQLGILGVVYIVMAFIYIAPAIYLWKYADRIALFVQARSTGALASALEAQKSFWKYIGILMIVVIIIYFASIAFAIFAGAMAAIG